MNRPLNKYQRGSRGPLNLAFEEGIDAGRKWGREEKDSEWRQRIDALHKAHWPVSDYSADPSGLVDWFVKELLGDWDIEEERML